MGEKRDSWTGANQVNLFLIALVFMLALLFAGLLLTDRSFRQGAEEQATLDATASARIVAQQVELTGERLHELSTEHRESPGTTWPSEASGGPDRDSALRAIWLLDSAGHAVVDSATWDTSGSVSVPLDVIQKLAQQVTGSRHLQLQGLDATSNALRNRALLGEPIFIEGRFANVAVALVDEQTLLAPAANAAVSGRSFLALLVDGDTAAQTQHKGAQFRQSSPIRVPLPSGSEWFIVSAQTKGENAARWAIWAIGVTVLALLLLGLLRERRQTQRIAERSLELERLSAELLRANRMKSEFLAGVSHELRTPLNAIVGFVDLLRDGGYGELSARQMSPVERIATSATRLRTLVDQVLDIARIAAERVEVRLEAINLRPFLASVVGEIEPLMTEQHVRVSIKSDPAFPKVRTDPTHFRQILINLLGNAVKYTPGGMVEIRTRIETTGPPPRSLATTGQHVALHPEHPQRWLAVDVADTGIGIPVADQERIFEEFEQVRGGTGPDSQSRGTGLGLPISRRLATLLGGDITVESAPIKGSVFTVWLPASE